MFRCFASALLVSGLLAHTVALSAQQPASGVGAQVQNPPDNSQPAATPVDPKTGLPLTPAEIREKEIDKYDPMKRDVDPLAQDPYALTDRKQPDPAAPPSQQQSQPAPIPGSVADSNLGPITSRQASSLDASGDTQDAGSTYVGPAVLTRSYTLAHPMISRQIKWQTSLTFSFSNDQGDAPSAVGGSTVIETTTANGESAGITFSGRHIWKRDQLGVAYAGNYSHYDQSLPSGMNHSLNLDYSHTVSRRLSLQMVQSVQDLSQNYSLGNPTLQQGTSIANINLAVSPNTELLNSKTLQSASQFSVTFRQSARLSYNVSSSYFITGRSQGVGMKGEQVSPDVNYRFTRKATVGAYYSFTNYLYSHRVSSSDSHGFGGIFSYAFNSSTQLRTRFGMTRIESLGYQSVPLPPELAAILGQGSVILNVYNLRRTSDISAELVRDFRRSRSASVSYSQGQSPGNGVLLVSVQKSFAAGYSMSLWRKRVPVSTGYLHTSMQSLLQGSTGAFTSDVVYLGLSRQVTRQLQSTFRVDYRRYDISGSSLPSHDLRFTIGLTFTPPDNALRF